MKKSIVIAVLLLCMLLTATACTGGDSSYDKNPPTDAPTTDQPTESETETETETSAPATETESETETETSVPTVEPTAFFSAQDLAAMSPTNAAVSAVDDYAHFLTGTDDDQTDPSVTLVANDAEGFSDFIAIKYRTNCGTYGSNFWGTFLLNGTATFNGNRRDSDNWFMYFTDGTWDVLILDMRRNKDGADGIADTDVTGGAAITSLVYNFFDYAGNDGKLATDDGEQEYIDIEYIAFFDTEEDAVHYCYRMNDPN